MRPVFDICIASYIQGGMFHKIIPFFVNYVVQKLFMLTLKYKQEAQRATYRAPEYNVPPFF